ncbi:MAG: NUDIX domain-containing protein [Actinobacteria bacterium]|jgi:8-oxo-dGTP diphosphatase|nr:NUDIX domain-containing protein [Actinomycetota bacterium]
MHDAPERRFPIVAVGGVAITNDSILLIRRGHPPQEGRWSIPGGKVRLGETLTSALEREFLEETGLVVSCGNLVGIAERMGSDYHFVILDFFVNLTGSLPGGGRLPQPVAASDADAAAWVPLAGVAGYDLVDDLLGFLKTHSVL